MLTEHDRLELEKKEHGRRILYLENVIKESARYERLISNSDFTSVLKDMEDAADVASVQIDNLVRQKYMTDETEARQMVDNQLADQCIRRQQIEEFINRPQKIISLAQNAREELARLKEKKHA